MSALLDWGARVVLVVVAAVTTVAPAPDLQPDGAAAGPVAPQEAEEVEEVTPAPVRLPLAEPGVEGSIQRAYLAFLGRPADGAGLDHWVVQYRDGAPLAAVADGFAASPEFTAAYAGLDDGAFVDAVYRNVFGRPADAEGRAHWTGALAAGRSRAAVVLDLSESPEHVASTGTAPPVAPRPALASPGIEHSVARVYLGLLGRWPDAAGFDHWVRSYVGGDDLHEVADSILAAPELARFASAGDEGFVRLLYETVLARSADDPGVLHWTAELGTGTTRGEVATAFTESAEMVARSRTAPPEAPVRDLRVVAVGDSVMLGAHDELAALPGWVMHVDTRGCRQPTRRGDGCGAVDIPSGVDALVAAREGGHLGRIAVLHLGNNGPMSAAQFDEVMAQVADLDRVIWLTLHEPRSYEGPNNRVIAEGAARYPNIEVVDWHTLGQGQPWFSTDGIHLSHEGRRAMARLVAAQLDGGDGA